LWFFSPSLGRIEENRKRTLERIENIHEVLMLMLR